MLLRPSRMRLFPALHHCKYSLPFAKPAVKKLETLSPKRISNNITCIMLSSETEQMTQGSLGFHEKSDILAVCPP
jgi:hypothetical protein